MRRCVLLLGWLTVLTATIGVGPARAAPELCAGEEPTIVGTTRSEQLNGTSGDDVILALAGHDRIIGRGGDDTICAGSGDDFVSEAEGTTTSGAV